MQPSRAFALLVALGLTLAAPAAAGAQTTSAHATAGSASAGETGRVRSSGSHASVRGREAGGARGAAGARGGSANGRGPGRGRGRSFGYGGVRPFVAISPGDVDDALATPPPHARTKRRFETSEQTFFTLKN